MAASGGFMNWSSVSFLANAITYTPTLVTSADFDKGISTKKFTGDADVYNAISINEFYEPIFNVTALNIKPLASVPDGIEGALTAVLNDAKNGAGASSGALQMVMSQAKVEDLKFSGRHREPGEGTAKFGCRSTDGLTNPVAITFL